MTVRAVLDPPPITRLGPEHRTAALSPRCADEREDDHGEHRDRNPVPAPRPQPGDGVGAGHRGRSHPRHPLHRAGRQARRRQGRGGCDAQVPRHRQLRRRRGHRRGREGQGAHAVQRRTRRQRARPVLRHRGRPDRRHLAHGGWAPERAVDDRGLRSRHDARCVVGVLHGQDRGGSRGDRRDRHPQADRRESSRAREGQRQAGRARWLSPCSTARVTPA